MKRLLLCLALVALMAYPAMAWVDGADVQAYVDTSVVYQAGTVDQCSTEVGWKDACEVSTAAEFTNFDCNACVPYTQCGLSVDQCKFESSMSFESTHGIYSEFVKGNFAVGSADMTTLGGVAICAAGCGVDADATAYNSNTVGLSATAVDCGSVATATYTGVQTIDINAQNY